uniref:Uncharacterized protein n=1 Tax=Kalanchoe fedtschenkoi TaxID=63787 RepID=A0A7N0UM45_KALFE
MVLDKEEPTIPSNLDSFLHCTTPLIPSQFLPKSEIRNLNQLWHPFPKEKVECFTLADLWNCYDEWSAYGAGAPVILNDSDTLVQYYAPYLSAIQIFTTRSALQNLRDETDSESRDSSSDTSSDESESDKLSRWDGGSSEEGGLEHDGVSPLNDRLGYLYFQYFETLTPYQRVPLTDKITGLARRHPGLMSLRNVDLSPASWVAIAWYPIYHIPMGRTMRDLSTCFLSYHTLSSSFQDDDDMDIYERRERKEGEGISLPAFGLATYRMQGDVWISGRNGHDQEKLVSLLSVADSWLRQLNVQHHDFDFFVGIRH